MSKLSQRIEDAVKADPGIIASPADIAKHPGRTEEYLKMLGLTKGDLVKLERHGMAIRGRTPNGRGLYQKENGQWMKEFGHGTRVLWILYAEGGDNELTRKG